MAPNVPALLEKIDGTKTVPKGLVLHTAGAQVEHVEMGLWKRALDLLIDPNIIALMLSLGLVGILVELWNPGLILPGTVGAISLLVGLYGLQVLPVSVAGVLLHARGCGAVRGGGVRRQPRRARAGRRRDVRDRLADALRPGRRRPTRCRSGRRSGSRRRWRSCWASRSPASSGRAVPPSRSGWARSSGATRSSVATAGSRWAASSGARGRRTAASLVPGEHVTVEAVEDGLALVVGSPHPTERA